MEKIPIKNDAAFSEKGMKDLNSKMRVCFIVHTFPSQIEVPILNQIVGVMRAGHETTVIAENEEKLDSENFKLFPFIPPILRIPLRPLTNFNSLFLNKLNLLLSGVLQFCRSFVRDPVISLKSINIFKYGQYARSFWLLYQIWPFIRKQNKNSFDVVHAQYGPNGIRAVLIRQLGLLHAPIITSFRGYDINKLPNELGPNIYHLLFTEGDLFTTDSQAMAAKLVALGCRKDKVVILPSSIDMKFWCPFEFKDKENPDTFTILAAGRLVECKGFAYLIDAANQIQQSTPESKIKLFIAGDGPLRKELEQKSLASSATVRLLGWVNQKNLREMMARADVFVLPSIRSSEGDEESQGLVLQEAQASGLPVIASNIGGIPEGMIDGYTGILVKEKDVDSLKTALMLLLKKVDLRLNMGKRARSFVEKRFNLEVSTQRLIAYYQNCRNNFDRAKGIKP